MKMNFPEVPNDSKFSVMNPTTGRHEKLTAAPEEEKVLNLDQS